MNWLIKPLIYDSMDEQNDLPTDKLMDELTEELTE